MHIYKITIEYDGTGLAGWQKQPDFYSVQQALEGALEKFSGVKADVFCAGRTDAGVHALGQVAHFGLEKEWDCFRIFEALNFYLRGDARLIIPNQIAVVKVEKAESDFHARFSAKQRYYHYRIINRRGHLALEQNRAWCVHEYLDADKMQEAAKLLLGKHDFTSFRSSDCQSKNPVKTLDVLEVTRNGAEIDVKCNAVSFLHHQVRNIVGTLKLVGTGKWQVEDVQKALDARDRRAAGPTAPAQGLYFVKVDY
jgi:tRNA pseudouridine38-40 synthase